MGPLIYALCALTSLGSFILLLRGYRKTGVRLLLWSSLCFFFLTIQNVVLFVDLVVVPQIDLSLYRASSGLIGVCILVYGLIMENK